MTQAQQFHQFRATGGGGGGGGGGGMGEGEIGMTSPQGRQPKRTQEGQSDGARVVAPPPVPAQSIPTIHPGRGGVDNGEEIFVPCE